MVARPSVPAGLRGLKHRCVGRDGPITVVLPRRPAAARIAINDNGLTAATAKILVGRTFRASGKVPLKR